MNIYRKTLYAGMVKNHQIVMDCECSSSQQAFCWDPFLTSKPTNIMETIIKLLVNMVLHIWWVEPVGFL